eukprot:s7229_g3.t2
MLAPAAARRGSAHWRARLELESLKLRNAVTTLSTSPIKPDVDVWELAADWVGREEVPYVVEYLRGFQCYAESDTSWTAEESRRLRLDFELSEHVEEVGHTWYLVQCKLRLHDGSTFTWTAPRRLAHLRAGMHEPVKELLDEDDYAAHSERQCMSTASDVQNQLRPHQAHP